MKKLHNIKKFLESYFFNFQLRLRRQVLGGEAQVLHLQLRQRKVQVQQKPVSTTRGDLLKLVR